MPVLTGQMYSLLKNLFVGFWFLKKIAVFLIGLLLLYLLLSPELLLIFVGCLVSIAFYVVLERKLMASIQRRRGPNVVGFWGLLQAFADALKLIVKEVIIPAKANRFIFILAPIITLTLSLTVAAVLPISSYLVSNVINSSVDVIVLLALSSFGVYGIVLSGWSSNSKYSFLGALRSSAQIISYEVFFTLVILCVLLLSRSAGLGDIIYIQYQGVWYFFPCFPVAIIFFIAILAETNRAPFDLPEAEAEIVAGYNLEYSSILFALFFLGEYGNMFALSYLFTILFLGGWSIPGNLGILYGSAAVLKTVVVAAIFIVIRANVPRYRYDQLIAIGWKIFLPFTFSYLSFLVAVAAF